MNVVQEMEISLCEKRDIPDLLVLICEAKIFKKKLKMFVQKSSGV